MGVCHSIDSPIVDVPRKGNVDRNMPDGDIVGGYGETFPARGTWIEIDWSPSRSAGM